MMPVVEEEKTQKVARIRKLGAGPKQIIRQAEGEAVAIATEIQNLDEMAGATAEEMDEVIAEEMVEEAKVATHAAEDSTVTAIIAKFMVIRKLTAGRSSMTKEKKVMCLHGQVAYLLAQPRNPARRPPLVARQQNEWRKDQSPRRMKTNNFLKRKTLYVRSSEN
jgi:hypothetical protein